MKKKNLFTIAIVIAITIGSFGILLAAEPNIVPNDPLVTSFMQSDVWWALKSQRDMAIDERISNVMNLGTHNSFNASAEGFGRELTLSAIGVQPNQLFTIKDQLRTGARLIELDVYDVNCGLLCEELRVKHGDKILGFGGSDSRLFSDVLNDIKSWLIKPENENEIIFLDIEDGASGSGDLLWQIQVEFCLFGGTNPTSCMIFTPPERRDLFNGRWPTRRELLDLGKRVIMFNHGDLSDGNYRPFTAYSPEDQVMYLWRGSDWFFSTGSTYDVSQALSDSTINDYWDGKDLPANYQQDLSRFFVVRSDGLSYGPRAMVGWDVAYCAMNNVNFIKTDFLLGQEYDIDDYWGTSRNDFDTPGGWDNDVENYSFLDNIRGNRLSRAIWSWQIDTYLHNQNIYFLSYQELHSPTVKEADRTDGRHYVVQEGFFYSPSFTPFHLILSQDSLGVPTDTYFWTTRGHWNTQENDNLHPFACAKIGSNGTEWRITQQEGFWDEGAQICDQEFNNQGQGTWAFAGPVNGWQNYLLLMTRWNYAYYEGRTGVATEPVWINVSDEDNDADWTVRASGPPSIHDVQVEPTTLKTGETVDVDGKFTDLESVEHTVTVDWGDGNTGTMVFPPGKAGSFSFSHAYSAEGSYDITLEVTDNVFTARYVHPIPVVVTEACRPPVLEFIGDKTVKENELLEFTLTATDPDGDEDIASYEVTQGLPDRAEFDPNTQTFSWIPDYTQAGEHVVYFTVYDSCNPAALSDYEEITITVENVNRAPVLEPIGDKTGKVDQLLEFTIEATDPDDDLLTYSAKMLPADGTEELPAGATLNPVTGEFSWIPDYTQAGSYQVRFSVSDGNLATEEVMVITVSELSPSEWMTRILTFFEESVEAGTLKGRGHRSWLAKCRLRFMRIVLKMAKKWIKRDRTKAACYMLKRAYKRCDGERRPWDFVYGEATAELASMIQAARESLGCKMKH